MLLLTLMLLGPVKRLDISKLEPVEAVAITQKNGMVYLTTDTKAQGKGETVEEALQTLKENASGIIYLDTARFLLIGEDAQNAAEELRSYLRRNVRIAPYTGKDVETEARYLDSHNLSSKPWG